MSTHLFRFVRYDTPPRRFLAVFCLIHFLHFQRYGLLLRWSTEILQIDLVVDIDILRVSFPALCTPLSSHREERYSGNLQLTIQVWR